ncbi:MAG: intradiol ring-cleavage dioxygenase [Ilumatobacteraceae bacterium]
MAPTPTTDRDHDDIFDRGLQFDMSTLLGRRRLLSVVAGAGAVAVLAACGADKGGSGTTATTGATGTSGSTAGTAATTAAAASDPTATMTATADASCSPIPEETAGPYPGDGSNGPDILAESGVVRSDITASFGSSTNVAEGVPLTIELTITDTASDCAPLAGAAVYLWHCDRDGNYSMYTAPDENYLRGVQETDADGRVAFTSIFPACYAGRWPHIHFEVYPDLAATSDADNQLATSQLALPQDTCEVVYATDGYEQSVRNLSQVSLDRDNVFSDDQAAHQLATMTGTVADGYTAALALAV